MRKRTGMTEDAKGNMSILIREVQDIIKERKPNVAVREIRDLLNSWVKANNLYPEAMITIKPEDKEWTELGTHRIKLGGFLGTEIHVVRAADNGGIEIATSETYQYKQRSISNLLGQLIFFPVIIFRRFEQKLTNR